MSESCWTEKWGYFSIRYGTAALNTKASVLSVGLETVLPHQSNKGNLRMLVFKTVTGRFYVLLILNMRPLNRLPPQLFRRIFLLVHKVFQPT